jgi:hypothetical protein
MKRSKLQALALITLSLLLCVCTKDKVSMFGSISGIVQDAANNKLEGVRVSLEPGGISKVTGKDGAYAFDELEAKEYTLTYSREAYITQTSHTKVKPDVNSVVDIRLALEPLIPKLEVSPLSLDFGKDLATLSFAISNTGKGVLNWKIEHEPSWFSCSPKAGTTGQEKSSVTVTVNRNQMQKGSYEQTFSVVSDGGNKDVVLTMTVGGVNLKYDPSELDFGRTETKRSLSLYNMEGDGTIDYTVETSNDWIVPEKTSGKVTARESLAVMVKRESLSPGEYNGSLTLKVGNESFAIPVKMSVAQGKAIVSINPVTNVLSDGAKLSGLISDIGASKVTRHGFCLHTSPAPTVSNTNINLGDCSAPKSFESTASGLKPSTTYYVRAYAENAEGISYSQELQFTTVAPTPSPPTVETGAASDITGFTAKVDGNISRLGYPDITQHGHVWSTSPDPTVDYSSKTTLGARNTTGSFQSSLNNLSKNTTYYVRAYATNATGTVYGHEIQFATPNVEEGTVGALTWTLENGTLSIKGNGVMPHNPNTDYSLWHNMYLTKVIIEYGVLNIGNDAFESCRELTSVVIPSSVIDIGIDAFLGCYKLASVTIPGSVTNIGRSAFHYCFGLTSITIPNSVKTIGYYAFSECIGLQSITLPNSLTVLEGSTFAGCTLLQSVTLPSSLESIGGDAFADCSNLRNVTVQRAIPPNTYNLFSRVPLSSATLTVPVGSRAAYASTEPWSRFGTIIEK